MISANEKNKVSTRYKKCWAVGDELYFKRVVREGITENMTFV